MKKLNAQELLTIIGGKVDDQKVVVASIKAEMDKTTDGITFKFLEGKLLAALRDLRILEKELDQCRKEVWESVYQERKARTSLLVENNAVQRAADMIMKDEFASMEAEFSSGRQG